MINHNLSQGTHSGHNNPVNSDTSHSTQGNPINPDALHSTQSNPVNPGYKYSDLTAKIIGCAMAVHRTLGSGFPEVIYQRALELELSSSSIQFSREHGIPVFYHDQCIGFRRVDFLVENKICTELKAVSKLEDIHLAQAINYLEAFNLETGLLINFGERSLKVKRVINRKLGFD